MVKGNEVILWERGTRPFRKKRRCYMIEIEKSKKKLLEAFKDVGEKFPFQKCPLHSQKKPYGGGCYYSVGKRGNRDKHNKYDSFQSPFQNNSTRKFQSGSSAKKGKYLFRKSKGLFHQKLKTGDTGVNDHQLLTHPIVRKLFVEKIPNVPLAGIPSQFVKQLKKIKRNQEILSIVKEYQISFTNLPVQKKPQNTIKMLEQHSLLLDQEI